MRKLKFKPTDKTVDFFNEFSVIDNLSVETMLNRVLCQSSSKDSFEASIVLLWYFMLCIDNLDNRQRHVVIFSIISLFICSTINDTFNIDNALEMLEATYKDMVEQINIIEKKDSNDMKIPPKISYGTKMKVHLASPAMQIKKYSKAQGITIEEAIEKKIEEMRPLNLKISEEIMINRFVYAVSKQVPIQVHSTIFIFISILILNNEEIKAYFEQYMKELKNNCTEIMETNYKYRRVEEFKEKIYKKN